jgi:hypothetical protein
MESSDPRRDTNGMNGTMTLRGDVAVGVIPSVDTNDIIPSSLGLQHSQRW